MGPSALGRVEKALNACLGLNLSVAKADGGRNVVGLFSSSFSASCIRQIETVLITVCKLQFLLLRIRVIINSNMKCRSLYTQIRKVSIEILSV